MIEYLFKDNQISKMKKATKLLICEIDEILSKKVCKCSVKRLNAQYLEQQ